eukprot:6937402-Pyramimonas_sp.AAC.1
MGVGDVCWQWHWGFRWSSDGVTKRCAGWVKFKEGEKGRRRREDRLFKTTTQYCRMVGTYGNRNTQVVIQCA